MKRMMARLLDQGLGSLTDLKADFGSLSSSETVCCVISRHRELRDTCSLEVEYFR